MPIMTLLHDWEIDQDIDNPDLQELLNEVREFTGDNWQIVRREVDYKCWFRRYRYAAYTLYKYVGGMLSWQMVNMPDVPDNWHGSSAAMIEVYLLGYLSGLGHVKQDAIDAQRYPPNWKNKL